MTNTDLSSSSKPHVHTRVSLRQPLRCGFTILVCSCLLFGAAQCRAGVPQDVVEAARQERARKEAKKTKHVYTDEDLRRAKILTPDDEARVEAKRKQQPALNQEQSEAPLDASTDLPQLPLGDIARLYHNAKRATQTPDSFHLPFDEPMFAASIISVPKLEPAHPTVMPARPNAVVAPAIPSPAPLRRVDPFTRRFAPPAPPSVSRIAPAVPQPSMTPAVAQPSTSPSIAPSAPKSNVTTSITPPSVEAKTSSLHTVIVHPGDSLWKLAQQNLGKGSRWQELLAANPGIVDPARIVPGTEIVVPANATGLKSHLKITVKQGDSLSRIAQSTYGRAAAWRCIAQANPEIADVNRIYEGQQLLLPFSCKP